MNIIQVRGRRMGALNLLWLVSLAACHVDTSPLMKKRVEREQADGGAVHTGSADQDEGAETESKDDGDGEDGREQAQPAGASNAADKRPSTTAPDAVSEKQDADGTPTVCKHALDRKAILAMTGTFDVSFFFEEVEAIADDYELRPPYETAGSEIIYVLADEADFISLQHVLVVPAGADTFMVIKHWRQDWRFEAERMLAYQGDQMWEWVEVPAEDSACTWAQAVYQVDDGPRYESFGRWAHDGDNATSTWTSATTLRPLPRREEERAFDYDVLKVVNTHIVHGDGWTHVEDNLKWLLDSEAALVREQGENHYRRGEFAPEALAVAEAYRRATADYWGDVRDIWDDLLSDGPRLRVHDLIDDQAAYDHLLPLAESELASAPAEARQAQLRAIISSYVELIE